MRRVLGLALLFSLLLVGVFVLSFSTAGSSMAITEIHIGVSYFNDWAYTETDPFTDVTFTVTGDSGVKATASGKTDDNGFLGTWDLEWQPDHPDIEPGDGVKVTTNGSMAEIDPVGTIESTKDVDNDVIRGTINAPGQSTVNMFCRLWQGDNANFRNIDDVSGANGSYTCDYTVAEGSNPVADVQAVDDWDIVYEEADGDKLYRDFSHDWVRANYTHDWVGANYAPGHSFDIALKDSGGSVKDTATIVSHDTGGWGSSGFETEPHHWASGNPQIEPGDKIVFESDDGYSNTLRVGTINGSLDIDLDEVGGTLNVPWLSGQLPVHCDPWGAPGGAPGKDTSAAANGSTPYECSWSGEWDIQPGQDVAVWYQEPDTDLVIRVYKEDAPNLHVNKGFPGSDQASPGGAGVFRIEIHNGGSATADPIFITDTLPADLSYVDDSLGVTPTLDGNKVIWEVGELKTHENMGFYLVTENSAAAGETLTNEVEAFGDFEEDPDDNYAGTDLQISAGTPDLWANLHYHPGNPTPGETFLYKIQIGNDQPKPSGETTLVVELPPVVAVIDWESREGYDLWQGSAVGNILTLIAPAFPGHFEDELNLRVELDSGTPVGNCYDSKVTVSTASDSNPDNDDNTNEFCTDEARPAAAVDKWFNWGRYTPGGELDYGIGANLDGNVASNTFLTDTMPVGTSFEAAWLRQGANNVVFPPDSNMDGVLTWDLGEVEPGEQFDINLRLRVDDNAEPGSILLNCAEIGIADEDVRPFDNWSCYEDQLQPAGTNLRIEKWHEWWGEEAIRFTIRVWNLGTTRLENVKVFDTYPEYTTFNGEWWHNFWEQLDLINHDATNREITWRIDVLEPDWSFDLDFVIDLKPGRIGEQGLAFTNFVEIPVSGDVNPDDNDYTNTAYSGPDPYVRKWLMDEGEIINPGDEVSFLIEFGNASNGWGTEANMILEDLLPDGMTYVWASDPGDHRQTWDPTEDGNKLRWFWGGLHNGEQHSFELKAKVKNGIALGSFLTNQIEIISTSPDEIDPVPENNTDEAQVEIGTSIRLPVVAGP